MRNKARVPEPKKILVVDDEPQIVEVLERYLLDDGFNVERAYDGKAAIELFNAVKPDLVLLDLKMPGVTGLDVFRQLRSASNTPVIMVTSRTDETDRVVGLELGADDYVTKPFSPREVVARVKTVLRRSGDSAPRDLSTTGQPSGPRASLPIRLGQMIVDVAAHEVRVGEKAVALTPTEFRILEVLAKNAGRTFSRAQLLDKTKEESFEVFDRTLDRHIANLRKKIEDDAARPRYVLTVFGIGYKMAKNP